MSAEIQKAVLIVSRMVILGEKDQPPICSNMAEIRRLLRYRLDVIEAALLSLVDLQKSTAAATPDVH